MHVTLLWCALLLLRIGTAHAHGLHTIPLQNGIGVQVTYEDGTPMGGAHAKIFSPSQYQKEYVVLVTDPQGVVMFKPNIPGTWIIMVSDNAGHGIRRDIFVRKDMVVEASGHGTGSVSWLQKIVMAFCVVWGAIGTAFYFKK